MTVGFTWSESDLEQRKKRINLRLANSVSLEEWRRFHDLGIIDVNGYPKGGKWIPAQWKDPFSLSVRDAIVRISK